MHTLAHLRKRPYMYDTFIYIALFLVRKDQSLILSLVLKKIRV